MTFTAIDPASIVSGGTISRTTFGLRAASNFDDHETRIVANESDIRTGSNALTVLRDTRGRRWHAASTTLVSNSATPVVHPFDTAFETEAGYSYSSGIFTVSTTGYYDIEANLCGVVGTDTGYYIQSFIAINSAGSPSTNERWAYDAVGVGTSTQKVISKLYAKAVPITAGQGFSVWIRADVAGVNKTYAPAAPPDGVGSVTIAQGRPTRITVQRVA